MSRRIDMEWKEYNLEDISKLLTSGGDASKYEITDVPTKEYCIPVYANALDKDGLYGYTNKAVVLEKAVTIAARGAGTGNVCYRNKPYVPIVRLISIVPKDLIADAHYLYYYFKTLNFKGDGSAIPQLTIPQIKKERILLPSFLYQKKISSILSSLDAKIENNNKINANLEAQAAALFKSWFVDFEPFKDGEFVESELGMIPKGWKVLSLTEIAEYMNGLAMQKFPPDNEKESLPVLKIKDLGQGFCDSSSDRCSKSIKSEYIIHDGDVIFSWSGTLLVDLWCGGECGLNQHLFKVTSRDYPKWFYLYWTKYHLDNFIRIAKDKAVTMGHIKRGHLEEAKVLIPSHEELDKIGGIISPMVHMIINNRIEKRKLASLRDTLLPKLMSGEIDLDNISI